MRALAPAKVNATLEILGRRPDGYHELRSVVLALDLCDEVAVRRVKGGARGVRISIDGPQAAGVPADDGNLAVRAARAALEHQRSEAGGEAALEIALTKRVPSQAGLGGGSSDAAAALLAAESVLKCDFGDEWRRAVLAELGSDCVFFLAASRGAGLCEGRGERVRPFPAPNPRWRVAVVTPEIRSSTRAVYAALGNSLSAPAAASRFPVGLAGSSAAEARDLLCNDLESAALASDPELKAWRELLDAAGASHFRLAGSGSSFFGLFDSSAPATRALEEIERQAGRRGLGVRGTWVTRLAGHGCTLVHV